MSTVDRQTFIAILKIRHRQWRKSLAVLCETRVPTPTQARKCLDRHTSLLSFFSEPTGQALQSCLRRLGPAYPQLPRLGRGLAWTGFRWPYLKYQVRLLHVCSRSNEGGSLPNVHGKSLWHRSNLSATGIHQQGDFKISPQFFVFRSALNMQH